ncbi:lipase 3 [Lasius niger]|uniref:Lipase 3 n=1 Tax=Lasius niger TaxID=67767 RepID=A0A0J7KXW4_LASNI|nr:lipase 3 [Lasius niger]
MLRIYRSDKRSDSHAPNIPAALGSQLIGPFLLSDNGYDVWLGNSRGTTNSKNHTRLSLESSEFWDFSWHEMGIYDLPAMIDYILKQTGQKQLFYIGFSQGTTQFFVLMSLRPEYNKKIKLMSALAPVAYTGHLGGVLRPLSFFANLFRKCYKYTGFFELLSNSDLEKMITHRFCKEGIMTQPICELVISMIGGFSRGEVDHAHLAEYLQFAPAGCSFKQLVHYSMNIQNPGIRDLEFDSIANSYKNKDFLRHFRPYDYGLITNILVYRRIVPPEYPVERITAPVILYNGLSDVLADPNDVAILEKKLPNLLEKYTVLIKPLSHFDFVYGKNARDLVYNHVIEKMNSIP